ncbi:hypothetical protein NEHOM01_1440 [Nematocida homosporus]|uniref:uncharacterized protein n=1 Tax=Nematocida homosporus TaxID=1912981 RepID=UPI00222126E1|nr:uncharacterized protein NEHOM01_1440 [Nematocida homosporus]KAI5186386.1 hypothetical protein NEHOM01_1440 [Nematocida homosporus]
MQSYGVLNQCYNNITVSKEISITLGVLYTIIGVYMVAQLLLFALQKHIQHISTISIDMRFYSLSAFLNNGFVAKLVYGLLMTQGLLERNLMQTIVCTLTEFVIMGIRLWMTLRLDAGSGIRYIVLGFNSLALVVDSLIMLYIITKQRKEFSWFHYKAFGANIRRNQMFSMRKLIDLTFKTGFQLFISIWIVSFLIMDLGSSLIIETILYMVVLIIYQIDNYELVPIRIINALLNISMSIYLITQIIFFDNIVRVSLRGSENPDMYPYLIITIILRILVHFVYSGLLIFDLFSFNQGILYYQAKREKKRKQIDTTATDIKKKPNPIETTI